MMKSLVESKWFPLIVVLLILITGIAVAFCCGFRITYAPELENSWEAISAVASWASVCATLAAVWAAIRIPKEIAKQQNKIALIKDRLEINQAITEVANDIIGLRGFSDVELKTWDVSEELSVIFSFATLPKYEKKKGIISRYSLYFADYSACAEQLIEVYHEISWAYFLARKFNGKIDHLHDLAEKAEEAVEFVQSEEFFEFKNYMNNTIKVSN